ncbi:virulence RhuM family protein [Prevotella copri]|uniref:Virulence RhuM family protein n=1 Tax=Segatella copri TaxID=165179 RepID=A0A6I2U122_9BACT|nr:virulence RhuM family protein [Segatella copri]
MGWRILQNIVYVYLAFLFAILSNIGQLFNKGRATVRGHVSNIFKEGELDEKVVCRKFRQTTQHGALEGKTQSKDVKYYNLDVIISVGYRVKSIRGT